MQRIDGRRGLFITLEGPDGAGKSSQARLLADAVTRAGREVVLTREPGGTPLGERIRGVLLDRASAAHDALADALLFNAARSQLVADVIRPGLDAGALVICDRFADSTLAYQGYGAGVPLDLLRRLAEIATGGLEPDRAVLLDLPPAAGLARRAGGSADQLTRFEVDARHDIDFHGRVRDGYLELARADPARWRVVDAARDESIVAEAVWAAVRDLVGEDDN